MKILRRFLPQALVSRVYALYASTWLLFIAGSLTLFYQSQFTQHVEEVQRSATMLIEVVVQSIGESAVIGDYDTIKRTLDKSVAESSFVSAVFIDLTGGKLVSTNAGKSVDAAPQWLATKVADQLYEVNRNISVGGKDYGVLRLTFDTDRVASGLWQIIRYALWLSLASLIGGVLLIWYPLRRWLGPLQGPHVRTVGDESAPEAIDSALIDAAPLEFRQTLLTLQQTTSRLTLELERRDRALASLRQLVKELMPVSESTEDGHDRSIDKLISTIAELVTQREQAAQHMREAKEAADHANKAKGHFLANMSHEIRTPMNGVIGMIDLALDGPMSEEQREWLGVARLSAVNLLSIINEILDFSKIEAGKVRLESLPVDVRALLNDTLRPLQQMAENKGLQFQYDLGAAVPRTIVGDPLRIVQIITNLVSNAIKFTESGSVKIELLRIDTTDAAPILQFSVQDSGVGISAEKQAHIFDPFAQEDESTTRRFGGTGLGLSICNLLAKLMGGSIRVQSQLGAGSTFYFDLPLQESNATTERDNVWAERTLTPQTVGLNVLVAEDHAINQKVIRTLLEKLGHRVFIVENGEDAITQWQLDRYDVILMDMQMPVMGGAEATTAIRNIEYECGLHPIPIYAVSAGAMDEDLQEGMKAGLDGYLTKPVNRQELITVLEKVVSGIKSDS